MSISTHVLDVAAGRPASGIPVVLEDDEGTVLHATTTDDDGRAHLAEGATPAGTYRLRFTVATPFFPEVVVAFVVADPAAKHHVPLLLSPYSYSTYRGS